MSKKVAWALASCTAIGSVGGFMAGVTYSALSPLFFDKVHSTETASPEKTRPPSLTSITPQSADISAPATISIRSHTTDNKGLGDFTIAVRPGEDCVIDVRKRVTNPLNGKEFTIGGNHSKPRITCTHNGQNTVVPENNY